MKVARATKEEIDSMWSLLNELSSMSRYFIFGEEGIDQINNGDEFPTLKSFEAEDFEELFEKMCDHIHHMRYEVVLINLMTLLDNCADPEADTLEFNKELTEALELYNNK